jgi:DNA polymerase-3 subunit delta
VREVFSGTEAVAEDPSCTLFDGEEKSLEWRDVMDELSSSSLFGTGKRLVIVQRADTFVTAQRNRLEDYVAKPSKSATLVLDVGTWAANTRLYKAVDDLGLQIQCSPPLKGKSKNVDENRVVKWLMSRATKPHGFKMKSLAAEVLLELVGPTLGLLEQDLAKLALYVPAGGEVNAELVQSAVGGWRAKTTWDAMDAALDGHAGEALVQLDHLLQSGEHPLALFGSIAWSLRRYAAATRIFQAYERRGKRIQLGQALTEAGFKDWPPGTMRKAEDRLKRMGRERAGKLLHWVLATDMALKGTHSDDRRSRFALEQLFLRLAQSQESPKPAQAGR